MPAPRRFRRSAERANETSSLVRRTAMPVTISIYLFGKPAQELDNEGEAIEAAPIRQLGEQLHLRLNTIADALDKLTGAGWEASMGLYDVLLSHPYIDSEADARGRIEDLELDPDNFDFLEWEDEEESE